MEAIIYGGLMHCETDCHSHTHSLSGVYFTTDFTEKCNKLMKPGNLYVIDSGVSKPTQINSNVDVDDDDAGKFYSSSSSHSFLQHKATK